MTLHIISTSFADTLPADLLGCCSQEDAILLIDGGCLLSQNLMIKKLSHLTQLYALLPTAADTHRAIPDYVQLIDYDKWVDLCCQHTPIISW